jgi:hypothetical protein
MKKLITLGRGTTQAPSEDGKTMETKEVVYAQYEEETKFGKGTMQLLIDEETFKRVEALLAVE